jgi:hypothetical protein
MPDLDGSDDTSLKDDIEAMLQPLSVDQLILMMTSTLRESIRLGDEEGYKTCALMLARELIRRKVDQLPFLVAASMFDVPW